MLVFTFIASLQRQIAEHPAKINSKTLASKYTPNTGEHNCDRKIVLPYSKYSQEHFSHDNPKPQYNCHTKTIGRIDSDYRKSKNSGDLPYRYGAINLYTCSMLASDVKADRFFKERYLHEV